MTQKYHCEILLNNNLDSKFQAMLKPLNLMQYLLFLPKYTIRDNFITPVGILEKCVLIFGLVYYVITFITRTCSAELLNIGLELQSEIVYTMYYDLFVYLIGLIINFASHFFQSDSNVQVILLLNKINRNKMDGGTQMNQFARQNWIYVIGIFTFTTAYLLYYFITSSTKLILESMITVMVMSFDLNIIYASQIISFLQKEMDIWCTEMKYDAGTYTMGASCLTHKKEYYKKMLTIYIDILKAYDTYKKVFQAMVSFFKILE